MQSSLYFTSLLCLAGYVAASPTPAQKAAFARRDVAAAVASSIAPIVNQSQLTAAINNLYTDGVYGAAGAQAGLAIINATVPIPPGPSSIAELAAEFSQVSSASPQDIFTYGAEIILNSFSGQDFLDIAEAYALESSTNNVNPRNPSPPVYPKASSQDAPYSLTEQQLRQIIYIPPTFTYGKKPPVLFFPGTGAVAGQNFGPNFGKLFVEQNIADPVYVNIPNENLGDIQVAAEYAAYAINYISGISNHVNVSTLSWSAGSLDGQWAFKYWPSTRGHVSDAIRISGDLHGTVLARVLCPGFTTPGCTPAVQQQLYNSTFIGTLRNNGGDSAYVPTTNVYSIYDEIVQPQADPNASGSIKDARGVGVANIELQAVCGTVLPGGQVFNDHEGVLINALAYAAAVDALTHSGPAQLSRINTTAACEQFAAPGLSLEDIFATYALIPEAAIAILAYEPKVDSEPPIMAYAQKDVPAS